MCIRSRRWDWAPDQKGGAEAREERAFLSGEAQRFPSRAPASLKAAKGANPAHMLGQEAGTSVPSSGGAEDQRGSGCPPRGGLEHWPTYVCLSPGPAKEAQRERPPERAMCPLPEAVRAGPCVLSLCRCHPSRGQSVPPPHTFYSVSSSPVATLEPLTLIIPVSQEGRRT